MPLLLEDAELCVARPLVGVLEDKFAELGDAPIDEDNKAPVFAVEEAPLPFEVVNAEFWVEELPEFDEGLSVATAPVELPVFLPKVDDAVALAIA